MLFWSKFVNKKTGGGLSRNLVGFRALLNAGFTHAEARRALIAANKIRVKYLAQQSSVTAPTIYATIYGKRHNDQGKAILSDALGVPINELFPDMSNG